MPSITVTAARKNLYKLIDTVAETHDPIMITGKRHSGVLISEEDYLAIQETLYLQSIPGMTGSLLKEKETPAEDCQTLEELDW